MHRGHRFMINVFGDVSRRVEAHMRDNGYRSGTEFVDTHWRKATRKQTQEIQELHDRKHL